VPHPHRSPPPRDAGFTLLELLVVIAILGLLVAFVAPAALRQLAGAKNSVAKQQIERLGAVLDNYKLDVGGYPNTQQGVDALMTKPSDAENWGGPYLKGDLTPKDPWNHPWHYVSPSTRSNRDYDLCSQGASGKGEGPGDSQAICNP